MTTRQSKTVNQEKMDYLRVFINACPIPIAIIDVNGDLVLINTVFTNTFGYQHEEIPTAEHWWPLAYPDKSYRDYIVKKWQDGVENNIKHKTSPEPFEANVRCANGEQKIVIASASILSDEYANLFLGVLYDITELKHTLTDLKNSQQLEESKRQILELMAAGSGLHKVLTAITHHIELLNPLFNCTIFMIDPIEQHLQLADTDWVADTQLAQQANNNIAYWSKHIKNNNNTLLGTITTYYPKTTTLSSIEVQSIEQACHLAALAIEQHQTQEAQQLARMVYDHSSEAMMVTDPNGVIIITNPAFTTLTGYTLEEVKGKTSKILQSGKHNDHFYRIMWQTINKNGTWQGELWNKRKNGELYPERLTINTIFNHDGTPHRRVALFSDISLHKETEERIWKQANFDSLTNLPNRRMFYDRLSQEIKKSHHAKLPLALLFLDLDHFKEVNDSLGHDMGDILLQETTQRLISCVRESDTIARLGGDEFTIILSALKDISVIERIAKSILQTLSMPFELNGQLAYISASIGITLYPDDATDTDKLIKQADQAMYAAKNHGRNRYHYFTPAMQEVAQKRLAMISDLHLALKQQQFHLLYQPIINLNTGNVHKAEALVRWQHPTKGLIYPADFILLAEEMGIIVTLGKWIFSEASTQAAIWTKISPNFQMSINTSPLQFQRNIGIIEDWMPQLKQLGLSGRNLIIEITEGLLVDAAIPIQQQLLAFRDNGIQVAIDDFGTGYSSLSYLKKFDIDYIKIDQSFVQNIQHNSNDLALCEAIVLMAHKLGIKVIAEGVETVEQRDLLITMGCDYGQGYFFSHPLSADEFTNLLTQH
jgi:diguanylate cyclase (GGDEF)-like protein/PAS domain S-box-containing protein